MKVGDVGFFHSDDFPYYDWGEICMVEKSKAMLKNFSGWHHIQFSLPKESGGKELARVLQQCRDNYNYEMSIVESKHHTMLRNTLKEFLGLEDK